MSRLQLNSHHGHGTLQRSLDSDVGKKGQQGKSTVQNPGLASVDQPHPSASNTGVSAGEQLFAQACAKHQQGNADVALELYQQAVRSDPTLAGAWRNLGALLRQRGQLAEAQHCTEQALALDRNDGSLWGNYGNVLRDQGQLEESCKAFQEGLQRTPGSKGLLQGLAISLGRRGEHQQVVQLLTPVVEQALLQSNAGDNALADLLLELGNAHHALEQNDLALQRWQQGTQGAAGDKRLFMGLNIAQVLCSRKQFSEAETICSGLEPLFPCNANLAYAQGVIARGTGQIELSIQLFEQALAWNPAYPICLNTYGLLLRDIGRTHQSRRCFEQALVHDPNFGAAMNNLGSVLKDVGRYDESLLWLRKGANALDNPAAHSNVLFTLVGYELEPAQQRLEEAQRFATRFGQHPFERWRDRIPNPDPHRRLKVGLISPDFCRHAVSYFVEPLLEQWDRNELEICLYSCGEQIDDYSARLQEKADQWVDLRGQTDEACLAHFLRDEIDILVDLAGHTAGNRLALLAAKAAPIQATYLGYYGTTGLNQVDYWITDPILHPPDKDAEDPCTETRWRLDRCYVSYRPLPQAPAVQPPPCERTGRITFGSFNQTRKITPRTAAHWMEVLRAIPESRLLLKSKNLGEEVERQRVQELFRGLGLTPERLELRGHSPSLEEHLACYHDVDIALDTFPYTGCTTTADALWMGVPVLTVAGQSMVSRQAAAVLSGIGKTSWICADARDLSERAVELSRDRAKLRELRLQQRAEVASSALLDHAGLARSLATSFRKWWRHWLQQQGWPIDGERAAWARVKDEPASPIAVANSPALRVPLWLGPLSANKREDLQRQGREVIPLDGLRPWGKPVTLFHEQRRGKVLGWLEQGIKSTERQWWQKVYPQLLWQEEGPLARHR